MSPAVATKPRKPIKSTKPTSKPINRPAKPAIDQAKLEAFMGKAVSDLGAALSCALAQIGDKLGLYKAMAAAGPVTSKELAKKTKTAERYVREWLVNQAAGGYIEFDPTLGKYSLPPEHAMALADENSPFFVGGGFQIVGAMIKAQPRIAEAFRTGGGMFWGEHDPDLFEGTERFFKPNYVGHLIQDWIPALDGVEERLIRGINVADIGCGHGASTIIMARAYPKSRFFGFDNHEPSIKRANKAAKEAGLAGRVKFQVAGATDYPGPGKSEKFDFITFFDCLHDMGDPQAAAKHAREMLKKDGSAMIVEPMAGNSVEENLNPVGRVYSAASVLCCTANAIACGGLALGTIASDDALREVVVKGGGFKQFRRATQTPFNRGFQAKP